MIAFPCVGYALNERRSLGTEDRAAVDRSLRCARVLAFPAFQKVAYRGAYVLFLSTHEVLVSIINSPVCLHGGLVDKRDWQDRRGSSHHQESFLKHVTQTQKENLEGFRQLLGENIPIPEPTPCAQTLKRRMKEHQSRTSPTAAGQLVIIWCA